MSTFAGVQQEQKIVPAFTVTKLQGKSQHTVHMFDPKTKKIVKKVVEEDAGFLVKFSKGHSIRARDKAHLERVGAGAQLVPLLDDNGNTVGSVENIIKEAAE